MMHTYIHIFIHTCRPWLIQYPNRDIFQQVKRQRVNMENDCSWDMGFLNGMIKLLWNWNWAGACGVLLGTKVFLCPLFLLCRKKAFSLPDLPWAPKGRFKQLLNWGERDPRNKRMVSSNSCQAWASAQVPPQGGDMDWTIWYISLSSSTGTKPPPRWRMVTSGWVQVCGPQRNWNQKTDDWDSWNTILLPHHQPIKRESHTLQPSQQICLKPS